MPIASSKQESALIIVLIFVYSQRDQPITFVENVLHIQGPHLTLTLTNCGNALRDLKKKTSHATAFKVCPRRPHLFHSRLVSQPPLLISHSFVPQSANHASYTPRETKCPLHFIPFSNTSSETPSPKRDPSSSTPAATTSRILVEQQ